MSEDPCAVQRTRAIASPLAILPTCALRILFQQTCFFIIVVCILLLLFSSPLLVLIGHLRADVASCFPCHHVLLCPYTLPSHFCRSRRPFHSLSPSSVSIVTCATHSSIPAITVRIYRSQSPHSIYQPIHGTHLALPLSRSTILLFAVHVPSVFRFTIIRCPLIRRDS